jgi:hypothetical protein
MLAPGQFRMIDVTEGYAYEATTIWRRYPEVGVALANPVNLLTGWFDSPQRQLRSLWLETAPGVSHDNSTQGRFVTAD